MILTSPLQDVPAPCGLLARPPASLKLLTGTGTGLERRWNETDQLLVSSLLAWGGPLRSRSRVVAGSSGRVEEEQPQSSCRSAATCRPCVRSVRRLIPPRRQGGPPSL